MGFNTGLHIPTVQAVVKCSLRINTRNNINFQKKFKDKIRRDHLPLPVDYYQDKLKRFYRRNANQATSICPFHNEKNPSFSINMRNGMFFCHGCGISGGDIISFHMLFRNLNFLTACKELGVWHE